jgi:SUMO ligase MMS21 Smc5/6 complex component
VFVFLPAQNRGFLARCFHVGSSPACEFVILAYMELYFNGREIVNQLMTSKT